MSDYAPTVWNPGAAPAISASNLNKIEGGIDTAHSELDAHFAAGATDHFIHYVVTWAAQAGDVAVGVVPMRFRFPFPATLLGIAASVNTAPSGSALIVDVLKNGVTVFTNQANRPQIAAGALVSSETIADVTALASADYLQIEVDQVGSSAPGQYLQVFVRFRR